jgi:hypothetical protein
VQYDKVHRAIANASARRAPLNNANASPSPLIFFFIDRKLISIKKQVIHKDGYKTNNVFKTQLLITCVIGNPALSTCKRRRALNPNIAYRWRSISKWDNKIGIIKNKQTALKRRIDTIYL